MEYKKTIILLVLVVFLLSIAGVSASEMDNVIASEDIDSMELSTDNDIAKDNLQTHEECVELTLTDNGDALSVKNDTERLGDNTGTYSGLSKEIGSGGNIELQHDYYTYDNGNTIYISVANSVIDGKGAVIDMAGSNIRAFDVHASGVTIKNLTIKNANYDGYGGAISFSSSVTSGNVTNCNFINNTASGDGGAIRFCSACAVTNCNFTDNTATSYGGAIEFDGTGNVSNCNFTGNTANYGGAVHFVNTGNVTNCNFAGNTANYDGGAVYFYRTGIVSNCNFTGNTAIYGGAVYLNSGNVTNCNFTDNSATVNGGAIFFENTGSVTNCNFADNTAYRGGAVYFWNQGTVTNCNFTNNTANKDGGAINMGSGTVSNCNFVNNSATGEGSWGGAIRFSGTGTVTNCNFTGNTATVDGGAVDFGETGTVSNCNFTNNSAQYGGAVHFVNTGNVTNCNFAGNTADYAGGAVFFTSYGTRTVSNCNFVDNKATGDYGRGGAVYFNGTGEVSNCNFTCNTATYYGGAIYFLDQGTVTNCNFVENSASRGGAIYSLKWYTTADTCIFKRNSGDNVNTVIYPPTLNVNNFTTVYGSGEKLTFDLKTNSSIPVTNGNISISVYFKDNGVWVRNYTCLSGEGWIPDLLVGSYIAVFDTEYAKFQKVNRTVTITMPSDKYYVNVTSLTTNNKTVNITAKTNVPKDIIWEGKLLFILLDGTADGMVIEANYAGNGTWWAEHAFNEYSVYQVSAAYDGLDDVTVKEGTITIIKADSTLKVDDMAFDYDATGSTNVSFTNASGVNASVVGQPNAVVKVNGTNITVSGLNAGTYNLTVTTIVDDDHNPVTVNATITVNKLQTELSGNAITATYNVNSDLVVTLKDSNGNPVSGAKLIVDLNGAKTYTTDKNGQVKVSTKGLAPKAYTAKVTFNGNTNYDKSTKDVKVTVKKATPKLTAKKKTFKTSVKTKKYAIILKDNTGRAIKKAKVTLKVKGKTYKATTNSKGKAVFKIKKLNKKGTFKATITYKGNKYYNKITKKANIKVIVTFKTVSKGSKDKSTVKEIQQALKDHGYYLSYKGHYLKVDGKFQSCTERSVKQFQKAKGLKVTGKVDEKTAKKLGLIKCNVDALASALFFFFSIRESQSIFHNNF